MTILIGGAQEALYAVPGEHCITPRTRKGFVRLAQRHGLFSANLWGLVPFAQPITTVVGRPIPVPQSLKPTGDQVDRYHQLYMKALERLFADHKEACGVPASTHLTFL
ncbi:2-acylglycerol O-acyltransferase 3 [Microtus ochrogaster]|uniref:2-acylglycerol O-acyltransferase 3 n=1 Tax=Microtus ochrogaster TaxID=79684 RepID=A0A8J6KP51_MICOH|nr:2-acylglycerol O-acyltransferase 3 [Microtus ochrogaster]